jgi:hypothetical protein
MFLYGFIFGSIIVYLICAEEAVLPGTITHVFPCQEFLPDALVFEVTTVSVNGTVFFPIYIS